MKAKTYPTQYGELFVNWPVLRVMVLTAIVVVIGVYIQPRLPSWPDWLIPFLLIGSLELILAFSKITAILMVTALALYLAAYWVGRGWRKGSGL